MNTKELPQSEEEWKKKLTPEEYEVMRKAGTERAFTGKYVNEKAKGVYKCKACGVALFSSDAKFDSGTGWPSFTEAANREHVELKEDRSHGTSRVEVRCKNCGAHLGHVFDDLPRFAGKAGGPADKGGKRFCINSVCLELEKQNEKGGIGEKILVGIATSLIVSFVVLLLEVLYYRFFLR